MFRFSLDLHDANNYLTKLVMANPDSKNVFAAHDFQTYFIKPASPIMYGISDLHDFIMIYFDFLLWDCSIQYTVYYQWFQNQKKLPHWSWRKQVRTKLWLLLCS